MSQADEATTPVVPAVEAHPEESQQPQQPAKPQRPGQSRRVADLLTSVCVTAAWCAGLGLIAAVVWERVTPLARFTRVETNGTMGEDQLARQFAINGWFFVIAAVAGLLTGVVLILLRRRSPVLMVVLIAAGGFLATWVMRDVGLHLGPGDTTAALARAQIGDTVPIQLRPDLQGVYYVWSIAGLLSAGVSLWLMESRAQRRAARSSASSAP